MRIDTANRCKDTFVGGCVHGFRPAFNLLMDPFQEIRSPDLLQVFWREIPVIHQFLFEPVDRIYSFRETGHYQFLHISEQEG